MKDMKEAVFHLSQQVEMFRDVVKDGILLVEHQLKSVKEKNKRTLSRRFRKEELNPLVEGVRKEKIEYLRHCQNILDRFSKLEEKMVKYPKERAKIRTYKSYIINMYQEFKEVIDQVEETLKPPIGFTQEEKNDRYEQEVRNLIWETRRVITSCINYLSENGYIAEKIDGIEKLLAEKIP